MASRRQLILDDIVTACGLISVANGYNFDIPGGVDRFRIKQQSVETWPTIIVYSDGESKELGGGILYECVLSVLVEVWTKHPAAYAASTEELLDDHVTDIETALMIDSQRAGIATETRIRGHEREIHGGGDDWIVCRVGLDVLYRHRFDDPEAAS